jgi:hypothetical protein
MKSRCLNKNNPSYKDYGGRGITVCAEWLKFDAFYKDMGATWYPESTIERKNVNLEYNKENCLWIPFFRQAANKTNTIYVMFDNERLCLADAARRSGLSYGLLFARHKRGATPPALYRKVKHVSPY